MESFKRSHQAWRLGWALLVCAGLPGALAQTLDDRAVQEQRRAEERQSQQRELLEPRPDVRLPAPGQPPARLLPPRETPCFPIDRLELEGDASANFAWLLDEADGHAHLAQPDPVLGRCLGALGVQVVVERLQHALLARGFVTSRVLAGAQNLQSGTLVLTLLPGRVEAIRWDAPAGHGSSLPVRPGDLLNLRDIEQLLENHQRLPSMEADIQIVPGTEPGGSELVVALRQARAWRLSATADDSGSRATGKRQGSLTLSWDNPLQLADLAYLSLLHDLGGGDPGERGTHGHVAHYAVPLGATLLAFTHSAHQYHQQVAGAFQDYRYSGTSHNAELKATQVVHRDGASKSLASVKTFQRSARNYVDDAEVQVQRRVTGGLEWGASHRRLWLRGHAEAGASYRRGTAAWGSQKAPEEDFGEGSSRMRLWQLEATLTQGFAWAGRRWHYLGAWRAQFERTPLSPPDRFAIGGRYSVRGFDGQSTLAAERGWWLRNELATPVAEGLQLLLALDRGQVGGPSASQLAGTALTGAVLGLRGAWQRLAGEAFVGAPVRKPDALRTAPVTAGFSLSWSY